MTLEKAIRILSELHDQCCQADNIFCTDTTGARCEAVDIAISALQEQDVSDTNVGKIDRYGYIGIETLLNFCENSKDHAVTPNDFMRMKRVRMPELCEDAVSRKYILEKIDKKDNWEKTDRYNLGLFDAWQIVKYVPSVTPKLKTGKWRALRDPSSGQEFSCCNKCDHYYSADTSEWNFCPNCGADMRKDTENADNSQI